MHTIWSYMITYVLSIGDPVVRDLFVVTFVYGARDIVPQRHTG